MNAATSAPPRGPSLRERLPAWMRSPMLLVPLSVALMLALLIAFASVVSGIVHEARAGHASAPAPVSTGSEGFGRS